MDTVSNKIGYLKGLTEKSGLSEDVTSILSGILDVLSEHERNQAQFTDLFSELNDYVQSIDDDLAELEENVSPDMREDAQPRLRVVEPAQKDPVFVCPSCGKAVLLDGDPGRSHICPGCGSKGIFVPLKKAGLPVAEIAEK